MRAITFAKTADGVWLNRETGVRIQRTWQGYHIDRPVNIVMVGTTPFPQGNGGWAPVTDMPCSTLKQAREIGGRIATQIREQIAAAYDEAVSEHIDRAEVRAVEVGGSVWRAEAARRQAEHGWHAAALGDVRRMDETTAMIAARRAGDVELAHAEAIEEYATRFPRDYARHVIALHAQRKVSGGGHDCGRIVREQESAFDGAAPVRTYEDGCQTYGPYRSVTAERTAIEAFIAGDTDTLDLPVLDPATLTPDIPDEALAMNAEFDLAHNPLTTPATKGEVDHVRRQLAAMAHVAPSDFTDNVRRYQH